MDPKDLGRYKKLDKLGEGTYGLVYRAMDLMDNNKVVAIKKIKLLDQDEGGIPATTLREISLLKRLRHPNIVELDGVLYDQGDLFLVFEFMSCDLRGFLDDLPPKKYLDTKLLKKFSYLLTEGIRYCHAQRILHRDLKPQNILIGDDFGLKIADFGLGREHGLPIGSLTHEVVTLWYRPPEIMFGKKAYSGSADVWGIGCIIAEMATKKALFQGDSEIDQLFQIYHVRGTPNKEVWPDIEEMPDWKPIGPRWKKQDLGSVLDDRVDADGIDLLEQTFIWSPKHRISAKKMLVHKWFDEVRDEMIAIFGNKYPHCGSEEFQKAKLRKCRDDEKEQKGDIETDDSEDVDEQNLKIYLDDKRKGKRSLIDGAQAVMETPPPLQREYEEKMESTEDVVGPQSRSPRVDGDDGHDDDEEEDEDITRNAEDIAQWDAREPDRYHNRYSEPMDEDDD